MENPYLSSASVLDTTQRAQEGGRGGWGVKTNALHEVSGEPRELIQAATAASILLLLFT